jgi:hypothetical protein
MVESVIAVVSSERAACLFQCINAWKEMLNIFMIFLNKLIIG